MMGAMVGGFEPEPEIGRAPSNPLTDAILARYLVGRAVASRVSVSLLAIALILLVGATALWEWGPRWLAVIAVLVAIVVAAFRVLVMAILRRVLAVGQLGRAEDQVRALVADTGADLRRELRRIGLPGSVLGLPVLAGRLFSRRRRAETLSRLAQFDVGRVVPKGRRDELAFVVRNELQGRARPAP